MILRNGEKVAVRLVTFTGRDAENLLRYARIGRMATIITGVYYGCKLADVLLNMALKKKHNGSTEYNGGEDES